MYIHILYKYSMWLNIPKKQAMPYIYPYTSCKEPIVLICVWPSLKLIVL